jgi:ABC-type sugar transport system substrate-binding protein
LSRSGTLIRFVGLLSGALLAAPLVACGTSNSPSSSSSSCAPDQNTYVTTSPLIAPILTILQSATEQAGKDLNRKTIWLTASYYNLDVQTQYMRDALIFPCIKGLAAVTANPTYLEGAYQQAVSRGISVTESGACNPQGVAPICFATDYSTIGKSVATKLAALMNNKGNVVITRGNPGDSNEQKRVDAFTAAMAQFPGIKIVGTVANCGTSDGALTCAQNALTTHPEMNAMWNVDAVTAIAAAPAYQKAGRKDILIVSADDDPPTLAGIKNGTIAFSFSQQPFGQGYLMVYVPYLMAEKHLHATQKFFDMGLTMIDKANVDSYANDVTANWQKIKTQIETTVMVP